MCQIRVLHPTHSLVIIPVDKGIYCKDCRNISNSPSGRCGKCGSEFVLRIATLIDRPPGGPDSGPASSGGITQAFRLEVAKAA
jgi:hypothetical protein